MRARFIVADVFDGLASLEPGSIDLVLSSPPFLALRSYLPPDHPTKAKEIGSEPTPADFIDTLLDVVEACDRVLAPHGSLVFELGDTYSGSGGAGGDYAGEGMRNGQPRWDGSAARTRVDGNGKVFRGGARQPDKAGSGWPLDKSLTGIPTLFAWSLAYGRNLLRPERTTEPWRIRNVVAWCRPNPPVGALGDKFRPATSYLTIATKARDRYFDLDAVRVPSDYDRPNLAGLGSRRPGETVPGQRKNGSDHTVNPAGAPPLDWWEIPTSPYRGVWRGDTLYRASQDCPEHSPRAIRQRLQTAPHGELREALLRNSRRTDIDRALAQLYGRLATSDLDSPDDLRAIEDCLDRTIRSERTTESTAGSRTPALRRRPDRVDDQPAADARTAARTERTPTASTSPDQTMATLPLGCGPSATPRSTPSRRRDRALATSPVGTPFAETAAGTGDTSASRASSVPHRDTPESSTAEACRPAADQRTRSRTAHKPSSRCSCGQFTESGSHYATWPPDLLVRPIKAMCPERVCVTCGKPSRRIVDVEYEPHGNGRVEEPKGVRGGAEASGEHAQHMANGRASRIVTGSTWTDCGHGSYRPGRVLDPFAGSGTTLQVATGHGREAIGIDLDERNADLARDRVGGFFFEVEHLSAEVPA